MNAQIASTKELPPTSSFRSADFFMIRKPNPKFCAALTFWLGFSPLGISPRLTIPLMTLMPSSFLKTYGPSNLISLDS